MLKAVGDNPTQFITSQSGRIINGDARFPGNYGSYVAFRSGADGLGGCYILHLYFCMGTLYYQQTSDFGEITRAGWIPIATATPPQWHIAALENGYQPNLYGSTVKFGITTTGRIDLRGGFQKGTATMSSMEKIFTLPVGFRPSEARSVTVVATGQTWCGTVDIYPDGSVCWNGHGVSQISVSAIMSFSDGTGFYC